MKTIINKSVIFTGITLALMVSLNAQAKIYKWTDTNGQVHYSAQPPAQQKKSVKAVNIEDDIRSKAGKYRPPAKHSKMAASSDSETDNDKQSDADDELAGPNKQLLKYCKNQRDNLEQLKKNFRNVWIDVKGKKTSLSQEQRREKVTYLQTRIKEDCVGVAEVKTEKQSQ